MKIKPPPITRRVQLPTMLSLRCQNLSAARRPTGHATLARRQVFGFMKKYPARSWLKIFARQLPDA